MVEGRAERRLAAILAADVVGYSRLMGEDEEGTLATLRAYREIIDKLIEDHGGRVFHSAGDSVVAEFASPVEAVRSATEVQLDLDKRNADVPEPRRMRFRIGVNLGDVLVEGDNLLGDGVNVAARLESLARPGGVCISNAVFEQVQDRLGLEFENLGEHTVKNIARPVRVYRVPLASEFRETSPFRGLDVFEYEHADIFHGRTRAIEVTLERLEKQAESGTAFLLIYGMSGSGKSSLLRAGLLPSITKPGAIPGIGIWRWCVFRPTEGPDPRSALAQALIGEQALPELARSSGGAENVGRLFQRHPQKAAAAIEAALKLTAKENGPIRLVVAIDQLEEIFTATHIDAHERAAFVALIAALARSGLVWVVATIRTDFLHHCAGVPGLSELKDGLGSYELLPPTGPEIAQMIRNPARTAGMRFEEHPTEGRLGDVLQQAAATDPASLPLLEFVLDALYEAGKEQRLLTFAAYDALGGLEGAIAQRADEILAALPEETQAVLPSVLRSLVTVRLRDETVTAKPASRTEAGEAAEHAALLDALTEARLLVTDESREGVVVRVAHEALLSHWPRAKEIIAADREFLETRARVQTDTRRWLAEDQNPDLLLPSGKRLAEAEDLLLTRRDEVDGQIAEYVEASISARQQRADAEREAERSRLELEAAAARERETAAGARETAARRLAQRTRIAAAITIVLAILAGFGAVVGFLGQEEAKRQATVAEQNAKQALAAESRAERQAEIALENERQARAAEEEAERQARAAIAARDVAVAARSETLRTQSLFLAGLAQDQIASGEGTTAILLALDALPKNMADPERPFVIEAEAALYEALLAHRATAVLRHEDGVTHAAFSPSGDRIATASWDRTARIWDAGSGAQIAVLRGHGGALDTVAFSPDGSQIVTASHDSTARVWDVGTGRQVSVLRHVGHRVRQAAFSSDGSRIVAATSGGGPMLWDARTGQRIEPAAVPVVGRTHYTAFSPDGRMFVTTYRGNPTRFWSADDGRSIAVLRGHKDDVVHAVFSPDGSSLLTVSSKDAARLWDVASGTEVAALGGHRSVTRRGTISPDGRFAATVSIDGSARLWDGNTGESIHVLGDETGADGDDAGIHWSHQDINAAFSPDGSFLATASLDGLVRIWNVGDGSEFGVLSGHNGPVEHVAFSPDGGRLLTASHDGTARLWEIDKITVLRHERPPFFVAFSPDGTRLVTVSRIARTAHVWDMASGRKTVSLKGHTGQLTHATFGPNGGSIATASEDRTVRLWDAESGVETARLEGHHDGVLDVKFSGDGDLVLSASRDGTVRLWDAPSGKALAVLNADGRIFRQAVFSPDDRLVVTALNDSTVRLWKTDGTEFQVLAGHESSVRAAAFSPDGQLVAAASFDETARIWNVGNGSVAAVLEGHTAPLIGIAFSRDGQSILTTSLDRTARIWNVKTGAERAILRSQDGVLHAELSPNGSQVVTASITGMVRLWDAEKSAEIAVLPSHGVGASYATFSPDGTRLVTVSGDNNARIVPVFPTTQAMIDHAKSIVPRELTPCERRRFFLPVEDEVGDCPN